MSPCPSRPTRVLVTALAAGALLVTAACSDGDGGDGPAAQEPQEGGRTPVGTATPALTRTQAETALITEAFLEDDWTQVDDADTWRDSLLVGTVDAAAFVSGKTDAADECQRLIDGLYKEDLLGEPSGASALTGFTEGDSRLLYQVAAYDPDDLDKSLSWLKDLPDTCDQFTVTGSGGDRTVQVVEASLPKEGDARQGMTVTVQGTSDGAPVTLTLDVAAVRVGPNAIIVTNGGVDGAGHGSTEDAAQYGTQRLKDVLAGKSPAPSPSQIE